MLFARLDPKEIQKKVEALQPAKPEVKEEPKEDNTITIDDFKKIELIVGTVEECKKHPDADKLLVSQINLGKKQDKLLVVSLIIILRKNSLVKSNCCSKLKKPAKLRGIESQGMILAEIKRIIRSN